MTAKEIAQEMVDNLNSKLIDNNPEWENRDPTIEALHKYAKYHVILALRKASIDAKVMKEIDYGISVDPTSEHVIRDYKDNFEITQYGHGDSTTSRFSVDKSSILLCYSDKDIE